VPEHVQAETQRELKARYTDQVQQAAHTLFKGRIGLHQLLRLAFQANGQRPRARPAQRGRHPRHAAGVGPARRASGRGRQQPLDLQHPRQRDEQVRPAGLPVHRAGVARDRAIRPVNDFKPTKSINLLGDVMYKQVGSTGELQNASLGDQAFANQAQPTAAS
jgi:hypothetical protein